MPGKIILLVTACLLLPETAFLPESGSASPLPQFERSPDSAQKEMQDRILREANKKRQKEIRDETERLYQLATELKAAVDKSNENLLSLEVVRKADEVEKLAKKVKEKMREASGPPTKSEPEPRTLPGPFSR